MATDDRVDSPLDIGLEGWKKIARRVKERGGEERISLLAGGVAFFGLLSVFPGLIALVSIYGLASDPDRVTEQVSSMLGDISPEAREVIVRQLSDVAEGSGSFLSIGSLVALAGALWTASRGVANLLKAINAAYGVEETRHPVKLRAIALVSTAVALLVGVVAVFAIAIVPPLLAEVAPESAVATLIGGGRWLLLVAMGATALALLYRHAPNRRAVPWSWALWGAGGATVLWALGSALFSLYVSHWSSFASTYGALAGVIIFMLWLYLTALVVLLGAVVNAELEKEGHRPELEEEQARQGRQGGDAPARQPAA